MKNSINLSLASLIEKLNEWLNTLIYNLPNIVVSLVVFLISYFLSKKINSWVNEILKKRIKQESIRVLIGNILSVAVIAFGLFLALSVLNLDKALSSILAGAGVAGLAVGLALQGTITNTFSGIFLAVKDVLNVGDFIESNGFSGTVKSIDLRHVRLIESDNNIVVIPNRLIVENPFKNYGLTQRIRVNIDCGVSYDSNLEKVKRLAIKTIGKAFPQDDKKLEFYYTGFGDSAITFRLRFWISARKNLSLLDARSEAIMLLKDCFEKEDISIPYQTLALISDHESIGFNEMQKGVKSVV